MTTMSVRVEIEAPPGVDDKEFAATVAMIAATALARGGCKIIHYATVTRKSR